jgi:uncharacterized protein YndB with AHSA1/START domain
MKLRRKTMTEIRHRVGIQAPAERVYGALTTAEGIASWWWQDARGNADANHEIECYFGDSAMVVIDIAETEPDRRVRWRCVTGPDEWLGTTITYDIDPGSEETALTLTHAGWGAQPSWASPAPSGALPRRTEAPAGGRDGESVPNLPSRQQHGMSE